MLILALLWLLLNQGDWASWIIGFPFILLAIALRPGTNEIKNIPRKLSLLGLLRFAYFFIVESFLGAVDISRRVLRKEIRNEPEFYDYSIRLQHPMARQFFINTISLVPGTLSADWLDDNARIHTLDQEPQLKQGVIELENRIASVFGEQLDDH